jgi:hypothetical protein
MSQFIQHPASSIKLSFAARRAAWLLALAALVAAAAVAVVLIASNADTNSSSASTPVTHSNVSPTVRSDGGPEEGTSGLDGQTQIRRGVIPGPRPFLGGGFNERYNGGPEEGTAGR